MLESWRLHAGYDLLQEHIHVKRGEVDAHRREPTRLPIRSSRWRCAPVWICRVA